MHPEITLKVVIQIGDCEARGDEARRPYLPMYVRKTRVRSCSGPKLCSEVESLILPPQVQGGCLFRGNRITRGVFFAPWSRSSLITSTCAILAAEWSACPACLGFLGCSLGLKEDSSLDLDIVPTILRMVSIYRRNKNSDP